MKTSLYIITNKIDSSKFYVGISHNPKRRWYRHRADARANRDGGCTKLRRAMHKYNVINFEFTIIDEFPTRAEAEESEVFTISMFRSLGLELYNIQSGGNFGNVGVKMRQRSPQLARSYFKMTPEQESKVCQEYISGASQTELGKKYCVDRSTIGNILKRQNVSRRTQSEVHLLCATYGADNPLWRKPHTEEHRKKNSASNIGRLPWNKKRN